MEIEELKRRLLSFYKELYRKNPHLFKGACKASLELGLSKEEHGYNYWKAHNILQQLQTEGFLEQKKGKGFRYRCCKSNQKESYLGQKIKQNFRYKKALSRDNKSCQSNQSPIDSNSLKKKLLKTFERSFNVQLTKQKRTKNLFFNENRKLALNIMTSKCYKNLSQRYWYTLTFRSEDFLKKYRESYVFLGCLDKEKVAYLIPFRPYQKAFLNCNITKNQGRHIMIDHSLFWCLPDGRKISLLDFKSQLITCGCLPKNQKKELAA